MSSEEEFWRQDHLGENEEEDSPVNLFFLVISWIAVILSPLR